MRVRILSCYRLLGIATLVGIQGGINLASASATEIQKLFDMRDTNSSFPRAALVVGEDGMLYGTSTGVGIGIGNANGSIFSFDPVDNIFTTRATFNGMNGANPSSALVQGNNGLFYGTTPGGGSFGGGTIFSFDATDNVLTTLFNFTNDCCSGNPSRPNGIVRANDGSFYGTSLTGGNNSLGTIFSFDPITNGVNTLFTFSSGQPKTTLTPTSNGILFGALDGGGDGQIFSFNPNSLIFSPLGNLQDVNFFNPSSLALAPNGLFYGVAEFGGTGGGGIFSFDPVSQAISNVFSFDIVGSNAPNGLSPVAALTLGTDGIFYGTTSLGGTSIDLFESGTLFSFNPTSGIFTKLDDFEGRANGGRSLSSLVETTDGQFYGVTERGGIFETGTIYTFNPSAPGTSPDDPFLPIILPGGGFSFDVNIPSSEAFFYFDPEVAIGYNYVVNSGPSIASVVLPNGINISDPFEIWIDDSDGSCTSYGDSGIRISGGDVFAFAEPVNCFGVRGIEVVAGLDPLDPLAFVTGLKFDSVGNLTLTQTPITTEVEPVPEPLTIMGSSLAIAFGTFFRRRKIQKTKK